MTIESNIHMAKKKITCFRYHDQPYFSRPDPTYFMTKLSIEKFYSTACHSILTK